MYICIKHFQTFEYLLLSMYIKCLHSRKHLQILNTAYYAYYVSLSWIMTKQAHLKIKHLLIAVAELMWSFFFSSTKGLYIFWSTVQNMALKTIWWRSCRRCSTNVVLKPDKKMTQPWVHLEAPSQNNGMLSAHTTACWYWQLSYTNELQWSEWKCASCASCAYFCHHER